MAREAMSARLPQLRVTKRMKRWLEQAAEARRVSVADLQREGLVRLMMRSQMSPACSCSPDDQSTHGCQCGAEVGK